MALKGREGGTLAVCFKGAKPIIGIRTLEDLGLKPNPITGELEEERPQEWHASTENRVLQACRKLGNKGIVPTIVLSEFYALAHRRAGNDIAEKHFNEIAESGLSIAELNIELSRQAGILRRKYEEQIPWEDCIIAATALTNKAEFIITEDPHLEQIREVKARKLEETRIQ